MQQGEYSYNSYTPNPGSYPSPNPIDHHLNHWYASAPPFSTNYSRSDYSAYPPSYSPYPQPIVPYPHLSASSPATVAAVTDSFCIFITTKPYSNVSCLIALSAQPLWPRFCATMASIGGSKDQSPPLDDVSNTGTVTQTNGLASVVISEHELPSPSRPVAAQFGSLPPGVAQTLAAKPFSNTFFSPKVSDS